MQPQALPAGLFLMQGRRERRADAGADQARKHLAAPGRTLARGGSQRDPGWT
jgi:hypothetical protein